MTNEDYQAFTKTTNCYPESHIAECLTLGLCSEAGEVAGNLKKYKRDGYTILELRDKQIKELGDVLWYISELCSIYGTTIGEVMDINVAKLKNRVEFGTIKGSGDER